MPAMAVWSEHHRQLLATLISEAAPSTPPAKRPVGLLNLPAELRDQIYQYTLVRPSTIHIVDPLGCLENTLHMTASSWDMTAAAWLKLHERDRKPSSHQLALLQICRRVRYEAEPIFYGANTFLLTSPSVMMAWLDLLGTERQGMVKSLRYLPMRYAIPDIEFAT